MLVEERKWFSEADYREGLALAQIAKADKSSVTEQIQKLYLEPIKEELIARQE